MTIQFKENDLILFQGDSITDAGRNRELETDLGHGYAMIAAAICSSLYSEKNLRFLNRGIGGNRIRDLRQRWQKDCLSIKPNWVSIMIGINDAWFRYDRNDPVSAEEYESGYREILTVSQNQQNTKFILLEPFVLPISEACNQCREDLNVKIDIVRKLSREFNAILVPLDGLFARVSTQINPSYWSLDGVHPTLAGNGLIAQAWLDAVSK